MMRRLFLAGFGALLAASTAPAAPLVLVRAGQPEAQVIVGAAASAQVVSAAETLVRYVREASGAALPLRRDNAVPADFAGVSIRIGPTDGTDRAGLLPEGLDGDGFVLCARGRELLILGPTDDGTEFGVYDVLERYVGVRWLMPGEQGTDVPARADLRVPLGIRVERPVFMSRLLSGLRDLPPGTAQSTWARCNRMHGRIEFHHNLVRVIPPTVYGTTHPEFFPVQAGKRVVPSTDTDSGWQPCFSAPGLADEASRNISRFFDEHPQATSYSLGINDGSGFCTCEACQARLPAARNFLGLSDYSDPYYEWCNRVIDGVLKTHPDAWFGCLAYSEVAAPPRRVNVHPRLVPYMTYDRMKWIHAEVEKAGKAATAAWHKASPTLGWYDYLYGTPYALPRVYPHQQQSYLTYGQSQGVKALYAELYPNWGEGPKPYLTLKLWWDPRQDVDALLREWYVRCVGPKAAPALARYYALWERFWTRDILDSAWFTAEGQYLNFASPAYLADAKPKALAQSRRLLDEVLARCETDPQRARAKLLEQAFQYYEATALAYQANARLQVAQVGSAAQALATVATSVQALQTARQRRHLALEVFPKDPVLLHPIGIEEMGLGGESWGSSGLWAVSDWVAGGDNPVRRAVEALAADGAAPGLREPAKLLLQLSAGKAVSLLRNGSFEEGDGDAASAWSYWLKPDEAPATPIGSMRRSRDVAHSGQFALLCAGMLRGGPVQALPCPGPGTYYALCWVYTPAGQDNRKGSLELSLGLLDEAQQNLNWGPTTRLLPPAGRWTLMVVGGAVPAQANGRKVGFFRPIPVLDGFQDGGKVYLDDVALYRVE